MQALRPSIAAISFAAIAIISASRAQAQNAAAETLFADGERLMKEGKLNEACEAFAASNRIEPRAGTLINLGLCREQNKQLASAWSAFKDALTRAKDPKKQQVATERIAAIEPKLSYLTVLVSDEARVDGLTLTRNGTPVDPALWNRAVPVDGGTYTIAGRAPGHEEWQTTVEVAPEMGKTSVEVPRFKDLKQLIEKEQNPVATKPEPAHQEEPATKTSTFTPLRKAAIGAAAVGLVGFGGTVVFGLKANNKQSQADDLCPNAPACSDPMAIKLNDDARSAAKMSNVMLGVGVVGAGAAVALWFIGAPKASDAVAIVPVTNGRDVGVSFSGSF